MSEIERVVDVNITRQTAFVTRAGFGIPAALGTPGNVNIPGRIKQYGNSKEILDAFDSGELGSAERDILLAFFKSPISPEIVKIIKRDAIVAQDTLVVVTDLANATYTVTVNGNAAQFTASGSPGVGTIATGLKAAFDALSLPITASVVTNDLRLLADDAGLGFTVVVDPTNLLSITATVANVGPSSDVAAASTEDDDFFGMAMVTRNQPEVEDLAAFTELVQKLFITSSDAAGVKLAATTTDIASVFKAEQYEHSAYIWSGDQGEFPEAVWLGKQLPTEPGSTTWELKELLGVTPDVLTSDERAALEGKNANYYEKIGGFNRTQGGSLVGVGEFLDVIRGLLWLESRMQEDVFEILATLPKVPYTNEGVAIITNKMTDRLENAVERSILTEFVITAPDVATIAAQTKATRVLPDITFTGTLAGAIHKVKPINGVVSV